MWQWHYVQICSWSSFETFLVEAAEKLSNKISCLGLVRQEKAARPAGKACRPGPYLKATAKGGPARPMQNRPGLAA